MDVLLQFCLMHLERAAAEAGLARHRIVIVDNASRTPVPRSMKHCPAYDLIRCDVHQGFAAGCNLAAQHAPADYFLFLNNDVFLFGDTLHLMLRAFAAHRDLGVCGTRLLFPDGTIQHAGVVLAAPPKGPYHQSRREPPTKQPLAREQFQAVTGACMLVRADVFYLLDGFDEFFSFGYEDIDFCLRVGENGFKIRCLQTSSGLHFESMTPGRSKLGEPTLDQFFAKWKGRYTIDG
jgi:GT2 family glycosyltransferase